MRIPVVNEQDEIIGYKERNDTVRGDICRVSSLWITDKDGDLLLTQRALNKKINPGMWGPAVSGIAEEGETYEENIIREAREEIGLEGFTPVCSVKKRISTRHEYFVQWYTTIIDRNYPLKKQDEEVEQIKWFTKSEIEKFVEEKPEMFSDNFKNTFNYFSNHENQN